MKVQVTGKTMQLPNICACCAEVTDAKYAVSDSRTSGNKNITSTWHIPYCTQCQAHAEYMKMGGLMMFYCAMTVGLGLIMYFMIIKPYKRSRAKSSMCKASCGSSEGLEFSTNGTTHSFDFPSETFAKEFARMNGVK